MELENKVELLSVFGNDEMICDVARVSYNKKASQYTPEQNEKLISYLWKHKHSSPFRHPQIQFRITCPIFVERQLFKHQTGLTANSISGRYVDFSDSYFYPQELRSQSKDSKQGSGERFPKELENLLLSQMGEHIELSKKLYANLIEYGVSKEQARMILPLSLNTTFIWTGSLQAYLHLFDLRLKSDAQKETRLVVEEMKNLLIQNGSFSKTLEVWGNERKT